MEENTQLRIEDIAAFSPENFAILEACLFAAGHPVTYEKLAETLSLSVSTCKEVIEQWKAVYNNTDAFPRGILLVTFPDSCQLCTREEYGDFIKVALGIRRNGRLSQSLLEALAVVAYNQPVTRTFVDTVRGVDSSYAMNALVEKNLIEPCGKLDAPGRPTLYRTTPDFLRVFGLESLRELPSVQVQNESGEKVEIAPDTSFLEEVDSGKDTPAAPTDTASH